MRHALRGFLILLFAVALVVNGGASRILADSQTANAHHIAAKRTEAGHQNRHQNHHHAQSDDATVSLDQMSMDGLVGDDANCCTMCITLDNVVHPFAATATQFHYRAVVFKIGRQHLAGHLVALDPDIPKTIV